MAKTYFPLIVVIAVSILSIYPLLHSGLPPTHDGEYHIIRFFEFYSTLTAGSWYPRWAADLNSGYGIPLFNFVYPLPNYVSAFLHFLLGMSFIDTFKTNLILATILGSLLFYFFAKHFTNPLAATVGAIFYTFTPYRFVDVFVRGSVGEVWSLAMLPGVLLFLSHIILKKKIMYTIPASCLLALLIFSHNILALLFAPFLLSFTLLLLAKIHFEKKMVFYIIVTYLIGCGIAAIFWLPALFEKQFVRGLEIYDFKAHFPDVVGLIFPSWGTGFSGGDLATSMSTQIGIVNLLIIALSLICFRRIISRKSFARLFLFFLICLFLVIFFMLRQSIWFWETIPLFDYVQFPWRYLSLVIFLCATLAAFLITGLKNNKVLAIGLSAFAIVSTISYTKPAYYHDRLDAYYVSRSNFIDSTNSPGNAFNTVWFDGSLKKERDRLRIVRGKASIKDVKITPVDYTFLIFAERDSEFLIHTAYFPGWHVRANGKEIPVIKTSDGRMHILLPKGKYFVSVQLTDTMIQRLATATSALSLGVLVLLFVLMKKGLLR